MLSKPEEVDIASSGGGLDPAWFNAFQEHQAFEVRAVLCTLPPVILPWCDVNTTCYVTKEPNNPPTHMAAHRSGGSTAPGCASSSRLLGPG